MDSLSGADFSETEFKPRARSATFSVGAAAGVGKTSECGENLGVTGILKLPWISGESIWNAKQQTAIENKHSQFIPNSFSINHRFVVDSFSVCIPSVEVHHEREDVWTSHQCAAQFHVDDLKISCVDGDAVKPCHGSHMRSMA